MKTILVELTSRRSADVKRRARELGLSVGQYLRQLIEDDLANSFQARLKSFAELAAPFEEALGHLSEDELDRRVKAARAARRKDRSVKKLSHAKMIAMTKKNPPKESWFREDFSKLRGL